MKTVIKEAAVEEDRCKSLIIFGLEEEKGEQLSDEVSNLFEHLRKRPRQLRDWAGSLKLVEICLYR